MNEEVTVQKKGSRRPRLHVPNDWSTLSNGTLYGLPTGLHRYVGEQRFVFGLLNVTEAHGDLVSYDLESKTSAGGFAYYEDLSGNSMLGNHVGATPVPGYFGLGARLSGSGSFVDAWDDAKLNTVDSAFTVAFWVKPDADYVSGSGWNWSFGRQGLWRLGFYGPAQGVRFEVTQSVSPYTLHSVQKVHPCTRPGGTTSPRQ